MENDLNNPELILSHLMSMDELYQYKGLQISEKKNIFLTINNEGYVVLLVEATDNKNHCFKTDNLLLKMGNSCEVFTNGGSFKGAFHILQCNIIELSSIKIFITLSIALAKKLETETNSYSIVDFFENLLQLFKTTPNKDLKRERQGLWGELFIINLTGRIYDFVGYWHSEPTRKFDFSNENLRLEVKTTTQQERIHSFSHDQLFREDEIDLVVASMVLQNEDSGLSLRNLINQTRKNIIHDTEKLLKLEKTVRKAGMEIEEEIGPIFDSNIAKTNLAWYNSEDIPKFKQAEPPGVSNTKYKVDLSTIKKMNEIEISSWLQNWE